MKPRKSFGLASIAIGCGLLITGFGLSLLFGSIEVPASGPAGFAVATLFGVGLSVLLFAALHRTISRPVAIGSTPGDRPENEQLRYWADVSVWRTKLAICFSVASTFLAFALFFGGIPVAFIDFNFASGTNDIGLIMMITGMVVSVIAIIGGLVAIPWGWMARNASGNSYWLCAAMALPVFQAFAFLLGLYVTR
jgi:hypothetical protein